MTYASNKTHAQTHTPHDDVTYDNVSYASNKNLTLSPKLLCAAPRTPLRPPRHAERAREKERERERGERERSEERERAREGEVSLIHK